LNTPEDQISGENKTIVFTSQANTSIQYAIGDIVGESYVLLSLLASGGMGVLFKARHLQLDRIFALKLLPPSQVSEINWRRFELEGRALAQLNHPNIVQIYNMGVDKKGCPFYVMELLEGQSMADYIQSQSMPMEQFLQSFKEVCAALQLTHSKGIVHRDIKPSNLFMVQSSSGSASGSSSHTRSTKVVDFGIARLTGSEGQNLQGLTRPGEVFGSPAYMSPEQTEGKAVTAATDIYSLGCTMYAALTGHAPFKGSTAIETMMAHQVDQVPEIKRPDFSPGQNNACNRIIARCMEKAPEDRFANVEQIARLLDTIESGDLRPDKRDKEADRPGHFQSDKNNDDTTTTSTITSTAAQGGNQTKWLIIAAISTLIVTGTIVAAALQLNSITQRRQVDTADLPGTISPEAQRRNASVKLMQEKMPAVPEKIDLEVCIKRSNKALSEIEEIEGKEHRVFNFPSDTSIGYVAPNKAIEKMIKVSTGSSKRLEQPAQGKIIWPDIQPVSFTGGSKITNFPEIYEHFDDDAIASLTLKGANRLPAIETLANWRNLRWLTLQDCDLDAKYTKGLGQLKHLQSLTLKQTKFDVDSIKELSLLPQLRSLQLDQIEGHSQILQALANSELLYHLELRGLKLSDADLQLLTTLPKLTQLDLRAATLPANAMKKLSQIKSLFSLSLDKAKYEPEALFDLGTSISLRKIYVSPDVPTDQMLGRFRKRFANIKIVRKESQGL